MTAQIKAVEPTTSEKIDQADQAIRMLITYSCSL